MYKRFIEFRCKDPFSCMYSKKYLQYHNPCCKNLEIKWGPVYDVTEEQNKKIQNYLDNHPNEFKYILFIDADPFIDISIDSILTTLEKEQLLELELQERVARREEEALKDLEKKEKAELKRLQEKYGKTFI